MSSDPTSENKNPHASETDAMALDEILAQEDPDFLKRLEELKNDPPVADPDLAPLIADTSDLDAALSDHQAEQKATPIKERLFRIRHTVLGTTKKTVSAVAGLGRWTLRALLAQLAAFKELTTASKLKLVAAIFMFAGALFVLDVMVNDKLQLNNLGKFETFSLEDGSDQSWLVNDPKEWESFNESLRRPRYQLALDKMVLRLKSPPGRQSMGYFELYLDPSGQRVSVEITQRDIEIRDAIQRTIESFTAAQLKTAQGKERLKQSLRDRLNIRLHSGYVRDVYFKNMIINE